MSPTEIRRNRARTKIVATVGPACRAPEKLAGLIAAGVDVFRLNMAHGSIESQQQVVDDIRRVSAEVGRPVGILVDLGGPKIRLGELHEDPTHCELGAEFSFVRSGKSIGPRELTSNYELLIDELQTGDVVMLADGTVGMQVIARSADRVTCRVTAAGVIRSRQGINLPGAALSVPAMTEADWDHANWAAKAEVDFVSLSFVRTPVEILQLKDLLLSHSSSAMVVAKIEKREALDRLDDIVAASDAVMVARGDLGVEIDVAETAVAQKRIIAVCQRFLKPVIVATQMLDSMHHSRRPTRAEVSDVSNAILDGADACMLSGETAIGEFSREAVEMMNRIMLATERLLLDAPTQPPPVAALAGVHPITAAVAYGAGRIASQLCAKLVVVATRSGATARVKSKQRDFIPTIGVSESDKTLRKMCLFWGITPLPDAPMAAGPALRTHISNWGKNDGCLVAGDRVVFVTGSEVIPTAHNLVVVHEVE
jgi:pyruvate kinase